GCPPRAAPAGPTPRPPATACWVFAPAARRGDRAAHDRDPAGPPRGAQPSRAVHPPDVSEPCPGCGSAPPTHRRRSRQAARIGPYHPERMRISAGVWGSPANHSSVAQPASAASAPELTGHTVAGRYLLTGMLGRGGFGTVYAGQD